MSALCEAPKCVDELAGDVWKSAGDTCKWVGRDVELVNHPSLFAGDDVERVGLAYKLDIEAGKLDGAPCELPTYGVDFTKPDLQANRRDCRLTIVAH